MNIKRFAILFCASALAGISLSYGQTGDNTSGRLGGASETVENRKDQATKPMIGKDGVTVYKDTVYVVKNGIVTQATQRIEVADGLIVDSTTITKNGQRVMLNDGQMLTFDGNLVEAPKDIPDRASQTGQGGIVNRP